MKRLFHVSFIAGLALAGLAVAQKPGPKVTLPKGNLTYDSIRPYLKANCFKCHSGDHQKGGLLLDTYAGLMKGGNDGAVIKKGDGEASMLINCLRGTIKPRMPRMADPLPDADIKKLSDWIKQGVKEKAIKAK